MTCSRSRRAARSAIGCSGCAIRPHGSVAVTSRAAGALASFVHTQGSGGLEPYVRACSIQLHLANIAEELERLRRRRHYDSDMSAPQRESLAAAAGMAVQYPPAEVAEALRRLDVRLTMTAHPTEATRRSVFDHQQSVWRAMERLDDPRLGRTQRRGFEGELREVLTVWWQTDAVRRMRPVVEDEVRRILFFFEAVLFDVAPRLEAEISRSFDRSWPPRVPAVRFGSWAGGDMDGNPEVTPESVGRTLGLHRRTALRLLRARVDRLAQRSSQAEARLFVSPALDASLEEDGAEMPDVASRRPNNQSEPFRRKLSFMSARIDGALRGLPHGYRERRNSKPIWSCSENRRARGGLPMGRSRGCCARYGRSDSISRRSTSGCRHTICARRSSRWRSASVPRRRTTGQVCSPELLTTAPKRPPRCSRRSRPVCASMARRRSAA